MNRKLLFVWIILLSWAVPICAESVTSSVVANGGGTSTGGSYKLTGTIGQSTTGLSDKGEVVISSGFWNAMLYVIFPDVAESFENWMSNLHPDDLPPEGLRGQLDAPAGDGVANILKYAFGLLPMDPSRDGYPHLVQVPDPANPDQVLLSIEFIRSTTANVVLLLEGSADLTNWGGIPFTEEVVESLSNNRERIRLTSEVSLDPSEKYFLRLEVSLP